MKRDNVEPDILRVITFINHCNSQVHSVNDQAIIHAIFRHTSAESVGGSIESLGQLAHEANISPASVSRFIKKVGYASFEDLRTSFARDLEQMYVRRHYQYLRRQAENSTDNIFDTVYQRAIDNLRATYESLDREHLWQVVRLLDNAPSVTIYGDEHTLADFYTLQLDLMARGVGTYLYKNEEMQMAQTNNVQQGDVVLFAAVSRDFVRDDQLAILKSLHEHDRVITIGFCQDDSEDFRALFDHFFVFGQPSSRNNGYYSLWYLSQLMSEMLYEL